MLSLLARVSKSYLVHLGAALRAECGAVSIAFEGGLGERADWQHRCHAMTTSNHKTRHRGPLLQRRLQTNTRKYSLDQSLKTWWWSWLVTTRRWWVLLRGEEVAWASS